ncbi:MAG: 5'-nucleotidase C-terminal domain-containing protein [Spirochaetaceae bacterium]|nr:5'-nucleotidase C-terminal domain-containing protein [Spirochaetaceae bacterium]
MAIAFAVAAAGGVSAAEGRAGDFTLAVVCTNDTHGYGLTPNAKNIGFNRVRGYVDSLRSEGNAVLLLDSGDAIAGNAMTNLDRGDGSVAVLNAVQYDAMAMGNHESDFGVERLLELKAKMGYPFLAANVKYQGKAPFQAYVVKTVNGVNVAVVGVVTPEYARQELAVEDPVDTLARLMPELRLKAGVVIVLAHLGEERRFTAKRLAEKVQGIDLILDGHDHLATPGGITVGDTLILNSGAELNNIGHATLSVSGGKVVAKTARLVNMTDERLKAADSQPVSAAIAGVARQGDAILKKVVATSPVDLVGERTIIRKDDTNLGRLVTDAFRADAGADAAIMNAGWIRAGAKAGPVTMQDVLNILAMGGSVVTIPMNGGEIAKAMELGFSLYPEINGAFFQVSGITFDVDTLKPFGQRVGNIMVGGKAIEADRFYKVAVLDILANLGIQGRTTGAVVSGMDTKPFGIFGGGILRTNSVSTEALANYLSTNANAFKAIEARRMNIK